MAKQEFILPPIFPNQAHAALGFKSIFGRRKSTLLAKPFDMSRTPEPKSPGEQKFREKRKSCMLTIQEGRDTPSPANIFRSKGKSLSNLNIPDIFSRNPTLIKKKCTLPVSEKKVLDEIITLLSSTNKLYSSLRNNTNVDNNEIMTEILSNLTKLKPKICNIIFEGCTLFLFLYELCENLLQLTCTTQNDTLKIEVYRLLLTFLKLPCFGDLNMVFSSFPPRILNEMFCDIIVINEHDILVQILLHLCTTDRFLKMTVEQFFEDRFSILLEANQIKLLTNYIELFRKLFCETNISTINDRQISLYKRLVIPLIFVDDTWESSKIVLDLSSYYYTRSFELLLFTLKKIKKNWPKFPSEKAIFFLQLLMNISKYLIDRKSLDGIQLNIITYIIVHYVYTSSDVVYEYLFTKQYDWFFQYLHKYPEIMKELSLHIPSRNKYQQINVSPTEEVPKSKSMMELFTFDSITNPDI